MPTQNDGNEVRGDLCFLICFPSCACNMKEIRRNHLQLSGILGDNALSYVMSLHLGISGTEQIHCVISAASMKTFATGMTFG